MSFCPSCGFNITPDRPIERDGWTLTPTEVHYLGEKLKLTECERIFLHTVARAGGRPVSRDVIGARMSDCESPANSASVRACHLRKKLPAVPFKSEFGLGYKWAVH